MDYDTVEFAVNQHPCEKGVLMTRSKVTRFVAILCVVLLLPLSTATTWAQAQTQNSNNKKDVDIKGRIFDFDKTEPLHNVTVRIVGATTGQAREDQTDKNGCYEFEDLPDDTYTLSVFYNGDDSAMAEKVRGEFLLPNKITVVASTEQDILIKTCAALGERNSLLLLDDCDLCKKVPPLVWIIPAGLVVAGGTIGRDDDDETSPSRP